MGIYNGMFHTTTMSKTQKQKNGSKEPTTPTIERYNSNDYRVKVTTTSPQSTTIIAIYINGCYVGLWSGWGREGREA